jgi:hypothetical protein
LADATSVVLYVSLGLHSSSQALILSPATLAFPATHDSTQAMNCSQPLLPASSTPAPLAVSQVVKAAQHCDVTQSSHAWVPVSAPTEHEPPASVTELPRVQQ